jgi:phosphoribosylformylglycinamidine cyclo-ligase
VQTNGLTLCRKIAEQHPDGYAAKLEDGRTYGEALLAPSVIYVAFVKACQDRGLKLNYVAHVTGHGWRKLMRLEENFVYEITETRPEPALFKFLMEAGPIELKEAYATFNMGIGFAAYVAPELADAVLAAATATGYDAWMAGTVKKEGERKAVEVPGLGITFEGDTLQVR